jgi:hypothetical protein
MEPGLVPPRLLRASGRQLDHAGEFCFYQHGSSVSDSVTVLAMI